jgi:hypothetical protein
MPLLGVASSLIGTARRACLAVGRSYKLIASLLSGTKNSGLDVSGVPWQPSIAAARAPNCCGHTRRVSE